RISYDLHPSKLVQLGLVAAIKALRDELRRTHGLIVGFEHDEVPPNLARDVSLCLYRVIQECLNNVVRHSGAKTANVELGVTDSEITVRVSDSGLGFDAESPATRNGLGLLGMRERLHLVGGTFSIKSSLGHGATIEARVPRGTGNP
ncbi:MAG: sensor histidine kinase, partial [Blastocatellia bacterium]